VLAEIVVTALKRASTLQDTPLSIAALTGDGLRDMGATSLPDYFRQIPNLNLTQGGFGQNRISIRGINSAGEATVGLYYDETPITGPSGTTQDPGGSAADLNLFDVERVEVLRGPQGTLYGSSSMAGTLRVIFNKPDPTRLEQAVEAQVSSTSGGSTGYYSKGMVNVPIVKDVLAARIAAYYEQRAGYVDSVRFGTQDVNDRTLKGARTLLAFAPNSDMDLTGTLIYQKSDADDQQGWYAALGRNNTDSRLRLPFNSELQLYNLTYNWRLPIATLTATGSYYDYEILRATDFTQSYVPLLQSAVACRRYFAQAAACTTQQQNSFATYLSGQFPIGGYQPAWLHSKNYEVRASSNTDGAFTWTAGGYYEERQDHIDSNTSLADPTTGVFYVPLQNRAYRFVQTSVTQKALFADVSYSPIKPLAFTVGARRYDYSKETAGANLLADAVVGSVTVPFSRVGADAQGWLKKFGVNYQVTPNFLAYASASEGFRPGGANNVPTLPTGLVAYDADSLWNYELGVKSSWFGDTVVVNAAMFQVDWSNIQTSARTADNLFSFITNAGEARVRGGEIEITMQPMQGLTVGVAAGYTDAKLTADQANASVLVTSSTGRSGDRLPNVPDLTAAANASYSWPLFGDYDGLARFDYAYTGRMRSTFRPNDATYTQYGSYGTVNLRLGCENKARGLYLFAQNLTDEVGVTGATLSAGFTPLIFTVPPRTIGINGRISF
jgi:outer membrane receptor protein involved in Fe transport